MAKSPRSQRAQCSLILEKFLYLLVFRGFSGDCSWQPNRWAL